MPETEETSTPVDNVVITTKGLHDTNNQLLDGRTVENKGKLTNNMFVYKEQINKRAGFKL